MYRHGLYVVGARLDEPDGPLEHAPPGVFAVERFKEAVYQKRQRFEIPKDARVKDVLAGAFGPHLADAAGLHDVVVEFTAEKAPLVSSRQWQPVKP